MRSEPPQDNTPTSGSSEGGLQPFLFVERTGTFFPRWLLNDPSTPRIAAAGLFFNRATTALIVSSEVLIVPESSVSSIWEEVTPQSLARSRWGLFGHDDRDGLREDCNGDGELHSGWKECVSERSVRKRVDGRMGSIDRSAHRGRRM